MKKIYLQFTRDFDQWVNEIVYHVLVERFPKLFGTGISDNIVHYTGRTCEWYRHLDDMSKFKKDMIGKGLDFFAFQPKIQSRYIKDVHSLRKLISRIPKKPEEASFLKQLTNLYIALYPYYMMGVFVPGAWREDFLKYHHNLRGQEIIKRIFKSRETSEGLLKEISNFMRKWLRPKLKRAGYDPGFSKILSVEEVKNFIENGVLPQKNKLAKRNRGFICLKNRIFPTENHIAFLKRKGILIDSNDKKFEGLLRGTAAYLGKKISGRVKIILNADETKQFRKNMILVTSMTAPEYLPIMKLARAIVTDEGGLTCHAAIVARELKKPCVIGTKIATKVFKDGDLVEVDANRGIIKKL
ncbi:hypothetical protein D4R52_02645 [bacterium]|nr:MAG: hypothetical protein D4R52_02645 [bacterium]